MEKCKIFIASSTRTLTLAEKLRDELVSEFCDATLWSDESKGQTSSTIIEMLEKATARYDFAAVILAKDDVMARGTSEILKARDNCVFEAGLFMSAVGRDRCFLVNSVAQPDLPTDICGIISIPFAEPDDLTSRDACGRAMRDISSVVKDAVQRAGRSRRRLLSQAELLAREQLKSSQGPGCLDPDQVVVTAVQPAELSYSAAKQVRTNIDQGVSYIYYFQGGPDGAQKTCRLLQMLLLVPLLDPSQAVDFRYLQSEVSKSENQEQILQVLQDICDRGSLKIYFLPAAPKLQYCIHNAASAYNSILYFKRSEDAWMEWARGVEAYQFWEEVKQRQALIPGTPANAVFLGAYGFNVMDNAFSGAVKNETRRYFRGIDDKVAKLCFEGSL